MPKAVTIQNTIPQFSSPQMGPNPIAKAVAKFKAAKQAKRIISALNEVKKIQQGKKAPQSFGDFLNEL